MGMSKALWVEILIFQMFFFSELHETISCFEIRSDVLGRGDSQLPRNDDGTIQQRNILHAADQRRNLQVSFNRNDLKIFEFLSNILYLKSLLLYLVQEIAMGKVNCLLL